MTLKRKAPAEPLSVAKKARSRSYGPRNNGSANSTPAAAMNRTSTSATVILKGMTSPVTKETEVRSSYENTLKRLADVAVTDHVILTVVTSMLIYAKGQEELVREFKTAMDEIVRSYLKGTSADFTPNLSPTGKNST